MNVDLARYDELVHAIYDAALEPQRWPDVASGVAQAFHAPRTLLFTWAHSPAQGGFTFTHNIPQSALEMWAAKSMHQDPYVHAGMEQGLLVDGAAVAGDDLVPQQTLLESSFYRELWKPLDIGRVCFGIVFNGTDARKLPTAMSIYRALDDPPFAITETDLMRRLLAHLSRALGVMFHLRDGEMRVAASLAALDRLTAGVVLLDGKGRVQFANPAAEAVFRKADTVLQDAAHDTRPRLRLHPRLRAVEASFQRTIASSLRHLPADAADHFSAAVVLPAADGKPACVVHAAPLAPSTRFSSGGMVPRSIVFLYDLGSGLAVPAELLVELFGMTLAEARAALQTLGGGDVEDMAARLGISANTFKTQLRMAYTKTQTHRQADLLKLLLSLAAR